MGEGTDEGKRTIYGGALLEDGSGTVEKTSRILSKSDILLGKDRREKIHLDGYGKDVIIRPLTDGELTEVFEMIGKVPLGRDGIPDLNLVEISTNLRALRFITALGMVEPELSEDDVADMKFGVPGLLAKQILELSGLTERAGGDAEKFRAV